MMSTAIRALPMLLHRWLRCSYDPADYDPALPTGSHPVWQGPDEKSSGESDDSASNATRRPGARRASAEWGFELPGEIAYEEAETAEPLHASDHPDSDASKAMAQWMVPITEQGEEQYPPIRQEDGDRRQVQQPVSQDAAPGTPAPFDRRQKPKSMKNLRSRFGQMEPSTNVEDAEFEESDVMSEQGQSAPAAGPNFAPPGQPGIDMQPPGQPGPNLQPPPPPPRPERRLADNSTTNMTPPEMPNDLTDATALMHFLPTEGAVRVDFSSARATTRLICQGTGQLHISTTILAPEKVPVRMTKNRMRSQDRPA